MIKAANLFRFFDPGTGGVLGYFLNVVALLYFLGAFVHFGNLVGFGEVYPVESTQTWLMLDGFYLVLDTFVGVGSGDGERGEYVVSLRLWYLSWCCI